MSFVLALDQGTTSSRALIFDPKSTVVGLGQREFTQHFPKPGGVDHDAEETLIADIIETVSLPVNVMMMGSLKTVSQVAALGVSRASYGPGPFITAMDGLKQKLKSL